MQLLRQANRDYFKSKGCNHSPRPPPSFRSNEIFTDRTFLLRVKLPTTRLVRVQETTKPFSCSGDWPVTQRFVRRPQQPGYVYFLVVSEKNFPLRANLIRRNRNTTLYADRIHTHIKKRISVYASRRPPRSYLRCTRWIMSAARINESKCRSKRADERTNT